MGLNKRPERICVFIAGSRRSALPASGHEMTRPQVAEEFFENAARAVA
jgi:hypothetical protein